jgi:WD40 repeat protein
MNDEGSLVVETDAFELTPGATRLIRTGDGATVFEFDGDTPYRAVFSPDGAHITMSRDTLVQPAIRVFDASDGSLVNEVDEVAGFWYQLSPDGNQLILGGADGNVYVYDFERITAGAEPDEALITSIAAHSSSVYRVVVSADSSRLLTAAFGEPARLWDLESASLIGEFGTDVEITGLGFHSSEPWVFIGESGTVSAYTYEADELVQIARERLTRTLTEDECALYLLRPCDNG